MIEYRKLTHGGEKISTLGLGMGGIQAAPPEEIEAVIRRAMEHGINFLTSAPAEPRYTSLSEKP